jgi:hypothetical protein
MQGLAGKSATMCHLPLVRQIRKNVIVASADDLAVLNVKEVKISLADRQIIHSSVKQG